MRFSENRSVAYVVLAAAIVLALLFGGGGALIDKRVGVDRIYHASSESISAELLEMRDNAATLLSIANKYNDASASLLDSAIDALDSAEDVSAQFAASLQLDSAVEQAYSNLSALDLTAMDAEDVRYKYKNFTSAQLRISHDPYNELAADFNDQLNAFPTNLIGLLRGVQPLELFQQ